MAEEKKDLTGLLQYSQALQEAGHAPPVPEGAIMEQVPIEKIDAFESLEDYAASNPPPEPSPEPLPSEPPSPPPIEAAPPEPAPVLPEEPNAFPAMESSTNDFPTTPPVEQQASSDFGTSDFPVSPSADFAPSVESPPPLTDFSTQDFSPPPPPSPEPSQEPEPAPLAPPPLADQVQEPIAPEPQEIFSPPAPETPKPPSTPLENVKKFAESLSVGKPAVAAAFPFSVLITGNLLPEEKEKILDLITRENMGIREIDLEPQLASGKVLIPRISEYAAVLIVQSMRSSRAQIKMGPSDSIFSTPETRSESEVTESQEASSSSSSTTDLSHPAENIPVTALEKLPEIPRFTLIDTLTASATLRSNIVEAESSTDYQELIEALQRELKYKAYRRGATAIVDFRVQLSPLSSPTHYRILAMGSAIKPASSSAPSPTSKPAPFEPEASQ